jgi:chitinase
MSIVMFVVMFAGLFNVFTVSSPKLVGAAVPVSSKRIVGYFVQWGIYKRNYLVKNVDTSGSAERMTHINYAFADVNSSLRCATADAFADPVIRLKVISNSCIS